MPGWSIKEKQSGTSVKGKPRISKKGNRYLRKAMHLPALAAIRKRRALQSHSQDWLLNMVVSK